MGIRRDKMWKRKERKNEVNKGKTCKSPGCNFNARIKGYCRYCYIKYHQNKMTYKKAGVDIEKEERAIQILTKGMDEDGKRGIIRLDVIK